MPEKIIFKKYANRRLYDTEKSAYVTLNQVADVIRQGRHVEVIDAKTKEDVTAFTLTQIIMEEAKQKNILLPVPLLHLIIQYGDNILGEFFEKYLQQMINNYNDGGTVFSSRWKLYAVNLFDYFRMSPTLHFSVQKRRGFVLRAT